MIGDKDDLDRFGWDESDIEIKPPPASTEKQPHLGSAEPEEGK